MTDLVPRALVPLPDESRELFHTVFNAALREVGARARHELHGKSMRVYYPVEEEQIVNKARRLALDACGLPYEMVPVDEQWNTA